ncbi:DUF2264 domain-containing protein [Cohaesibacter celericrescens]|uniref:DUF2264 domain-containing protein n=1 Tax=Cohaesibacter celericrescens TaxID=2067669 RepID=UPI003565C213
MSLRLDGFSDNPMRSRADFQDAARALNKPLIPFLDRGGAALDLEEGAAKFDMRASSLEGVVRPLWGLVPLALGGGAFSHWPLFQRAICEGVDPEHPRFWGAIGDVDQRAVEMAAIGFLLAALPNEGWDQLPETSQEHLVNWLSAMQKVPMSQNNWLFFTVLVQQGLKRIGRGDIVDLALEHKHLQQLADWYRGDGWYGDGGSKAVDHYGGFAMHFYGMLYGWLKGDQPDEFSVLFRKRASEFAVPFSHWFADNGEAMIQGRSLTYRFATAAYWGMLAVSGERPLSIGQIKGVWARQLRVWRDRPIFRSDGILSRGFAYPSLMVCEDYNSPTSPYWAMKAFMPLALDEASDFWQADEEPLDDLRSVYAMPHADSLVQRVEGHAISHFAAPIHTWLQMDKYNKFAYSTVCGFDVGSLQYANMGIFGDNLLAFSFDDGANWQMRQKNLDVCVADDNLTVRWSTGALEVETKIEVVGDGLFTRSHAFELSVPTQVVETGFAVNQWYREAERLDPADAHQAILLNGENALSGILPMDDLPRQSIACGRVNSNMLSPRTLVPGFSLSLAAGNHQIKHGFWLSPDKREEKCEAFLALQKGH